MYKCPNCKYLWNLNIGDKCPKCGKIRRVRSRAVEIVIAWIWISVVILAGSYLLSIVLFSRGFRPGGF